VTRHAATALTCLVLLAAGCGEEPVATTPAPAPKAPIAPPSPGGEGEASAEAELVDPANAAPTYTYNPKGRRDPFQSYRHDLADDQDKVQTPLMAYELGQLSVVAVVWDATKRRALIADPRGETHVVKEGSPIGKNDGLVIHIGDNIVLVKETYIDFAGEMTTKDVELRIRRSQGG
jgi:type IV pilus assembly protein PilP